LPRLLPATNNCGLWSSPQQLGSHHIIFWRHYLFGQNRSRAHTSFQLAT
jgi:hypothetical protein